MDFKVKVGKGRKKSVKQIDSIAQGRVWSGIQAKEIGLIDEFGGLNHAIKIAAGKANLEEYDLVELPKMKEPFEDFLDNWMDKESLIEKKIQKELGLNYESYKQLSHITKYKGVQMRMPYSITLY
jgi:protease-4